MRSVRLDYQRRTRHVPWLGAGLLLLALLTLAAASARYYDLNRQIAMAQASLEQAQRQAGRGSSARMAGDRDARALAPEIRVANDALRRLTRPWQALLEAVESTGGSEVALLAMEPDVQKGTVKISAEARHAQAMLDYVGRLMAQPALGDVHLQSHQVQQHDAQKPVRFSVLAASRGEAP